MRKSNNLQNAIHILVSNFLAIIIKFFRVSEASA